MGVDARGFPGGTPLCVCRASFLMTFAMGRVPHAGPQQLPTAQDCKGLNVMAKYETLYREILFRAFAGLAKVSTTYSAVVIFL